MIDITHFHVHWKDLAEKDHVKVITPENAENTLIMKKQIAEFVNANKTKMMYYYVVMEVNRGGKPAYRTIIPKTIPKV